MAKAVEYFDYSSVEDRIADVEYWIAAGADVNAIVCGLTPLHLAVQRSARMVQFLIEAGADVHARAYDGRTPLHMTNSWNEEALVIRTLIDAGADVNARDLSGRTPTYMASYSGSDTGLGALLANGADAAEADGSGTTPLYEASRVGSCQKIVLLLDAGADPNAGDGKFKPLFIAAEKGYTDVVQILIEAGADPRVTDNRGRNPLRHAVKAGERKTARFIRQEMGRFPKTATPTRKIQENTPSPPEAPRQTLPEAQGPTAKPTAAAFYPTWVRKVSAMALKVYSRNLRLPCKEDHMPTISIIGAPGSGKSHFATLLYMHLLQHKELDVFVSHLGNPRHNIINSAMGLAAGLPLEPTPKDMLVKNEIEVKFPEKQPGGFWKSPKEVDKLLRIPIMDSAGELLQVAMENILQTRGDIDPAQLIEKLEEQRFDPALITDLYNQVFRADGFCFVVDACNEKFNPRNTVIGSHAVMLQNLGEYRRKHKELEPIKNAMLVLTKYDGIRGTMDEAVMQGQKSGEVTERAFIGENLASMLLAQLRGQAGYNEANPVITILSSTEWATPPMTSDDEIQEKYGPNVDSVRKQELREGRFRTQTLPNGIPLPVYDQDEYELVVDWLKKL